MITCYPILRQHILDAGISYGELATLVSIGRLSFHLKMLGIKRWKLTEVVNICCFFNTKDAEHLFYKKGV